ncbi:MAG TPA: VWA domain-containing protein [Candidatus Limnocylindria bacterium]|nr:VWA domain-containing protein [Candidatus Limnocylindria bacterium]
MSFLSPLALLGLLFLPVVLAMYLLKLRRDERVVPSTLMWQRLLTDVEANAPWQKLRRSLLLLLQLLLVALLAILAARPFLERPAGLAGDVVVVLDTSASMAATDVPPSRLDEAKRQVLEALRELPANGTVSVIAAGGSARVVVNGTTDLGRVRAAIEGVTVSSARGDLGDALNLANALAARAGDADILVATDAALALKPTARVDHEVRVIQVGRERKNQAIVALAVRPASSGVTRSVFVSIANLDIERADRRVEVYADDVLIEAAPKTLEAQARTEIVIDDIPQGASVIEVRLTGPEGAQGGPPDALSVDDRAWAIIPPERLRRILLVGEGDPYLETALTYLPNSELYGVKPSLYGPTTHPELFDLIIFEGFLPPVIPKTAVLAISPTTSSDLGAVLGTLTDPGIATISPDEPILKLIDLSTVHIGKAAKLELPVWARSVIPGPAGSPLLYVGELEGQKAAVMAFLPRNSDLPLQVAFPLLIANLTGELLGGSAVPTEALAPGDPVQIPLPAGATSMTVTRPDGSTVELAPATVGAASVAFSQTELLGVYIASATFPEPTAGPSGGVLPSAVPTAPPSGSPAPPPTLAPGATASPVPTAPPVNPNAPVRFAVDLFDPSESNIAPGSAADLVALGRQPGASGAPASLAASPGATDEPGASGVAGGGTGAGAAEERAVARDELWVLVVLVVLVFLVAEWLVYHRDAVTRLWRSFRRGTAGGQAAGSGGTGSGASGSGTGTVGRR